MLLLLLSIGIVISIGPVLIVGLVVVEVLGVPLWHTGVVARVVGVVGGGVRGGCVGGTAVDAGGLVVGRVGGGGTVDDTQRANGVRVHGFTTAVDEGIVGVCVRVSAVGGRVGARVAAGVAVAVRVGHARGEGGGGLAVGRGGRVAPAAVAAVVFGHGEAADGRQGGVVVGVEAILLDLLAALVLCGLALLAFPPEEETSKH